MKTILLLAAVATLAIAGSASAATYNFIQTGFGIPETGADGGGVLKLSFTGVDANHDGVLDGGRFVFGNFNEISSATISFSGDSLFKKFREKFDFGNDSIQYTIGTAQLGTANGDGVSHGGRTAGYSTGLLWGDPNGDGSIGGLVAFDNNNANRFIFDETFNQLQLVPDPAPEPAAFALLGLGAATLGLARRRRG